MAKEVPPGDGGLARLDHLEQLVAVLGLEGRAAGHHLVDQAAEAPPVHRLLVALAVHDLGRQVLGRAADRLRALGLGQDLREPEVGELHVPLLVDQDVLGLQAAWGQKYSR